ncbi:MAG: conjugal transfer protein TraF [Porticoccaceae bacterium]
MQSIRRPLSTFGVHAIDQQAGTSKKDVLKSIASQTGIWYFFASYCPYCKLQSPVLKSYAETYGFEILPVSTDGGPDPANSFPDYKASMLTRHKSSTSRRRQHCFCTRRAKYQKSSLLD